MPVLRQVQMSVPVEIRRAALQYAALHFHDGHKPAQIQLGPGVAFERNRFGISWGNLIIDVPVVQRPDLKPGHLRIADKLWSCPEHVKAGHSWDGQHVAATV